jgi:uncharacterized protein (DUF1499 family)
MIFASENEFKCGDRPNCVSSYDNRPSFSVPSLTYSDNVDVVKKRLKKLLDNLSAEKVSETETVWHYIVKTPFFKFKDDIYFNFEQNGKIGVKSSSRLGYYDFSANRKRVEAIRSQL